MVLVHISNFVFIGKEDLPYGRVLEEGQLSEKGVVLPSRKDVWILVLH